MNIRPRPRLSAGILAATLAALLLLFLPGCRNPLQHENRAEPGTVSLRLGGPEGRTIRPTTPGAGDFARFELVFTPGGGASLAPIVWDDGRTYGSVELTAGQWSLAVNAFMGADDTEPSATGGSGTFTLGAGDFIPLAVSLFPFYDGGTGTFAWDLELDAVIATATMAVYPYGGAIAAWGPRYLRGGPDAVGYDDRTELPAGRYTVVLTLGDGERTITLTEALHVYRNLESLFDGLFGSANFAECPVSYITDAILGAWDGTQWDFGAVDIRAGHFAFLEAEGVLFGVGAGNFDDVVYWFGRFAGSIPAPADFGLAELGVLVDAALIGAGTGGGFVSAADYWADAQAGIEAMAANDTGLAFFWDGYYRVLNIGIGGAGLGSADDTDYAVTVEFEQSLLPPVDPHPLAGRLLILQAGASGGDGAIGRSFIELYNDTAEDIVLDGFTLQYAAGASTNAAWAATETAPWTAIPLTGIIPARGSFLVAGNPVGNPANQRFTITDNEADVVADMRLSNRSFKVALMASPYRLRVANPSAMPRGGAAAGFIDLLGALNSPPGDGVDAFETAPAAVISQQASARRRSLVDTDDNSADFVRVDFRHLPGEGTPSNAGGTSIADFERVRPKNSSHGAWAPFGYPAHPLAGRLLILQAGAAGTDGAIGRSFIELYNNTAEDIDLDGFTLQYAAGSSTNAAWLSPVTAPWTAIPLTGTIPARGSFLVAGNLVTNPANQRFTITDDEADMVADIRLSNRSFKVALMASPDTLAVANPFAMPGWGTVEGFVDLLGALNSTPGDGVDAFEAAPAVVISQQAAARRRSLVDTDDNSADFERIDFRPAATPDALLAQVRPRSSDDGAWTPFPEGGWSPAQVAFSHNTGLHNNPFYLTLTAPLGYAIYYSIDGSIPFPVNVGNGRVFRYTAPIAVVDRTGHPNLLATPENTEQFHLHPDDTRWPGGGARPFFPTDDQVRKATVIRAVAIDPVGNRTDVSTRTFFISDNLRYYANHPIISIVTDPHNLLDEDTGIYVRGHETNRWPNINFNMRGRDWEREAFFELLDGQRNVSLSTGVGIRIRGGASRQFGQKSLNVFFRGEYGIDTLRNFELIPGAVQSNGHPLTTWRSFALRNGGNCTQRTKLIDVLIQSLVADRSFTTLASIPVIVYLNGEFWGPYNLRERVSDNHTEFRYGVNRNNVIAWENGEIDEGTVAEGESLFLNKNRDFRARDMSVQQNFEEFSASFDVQSFIDYFATQIYVNNHDWPSNNYRLWRVRNLDPGNPYGDGRWRWQMTDTDISLGRPFTDASNAQDPFYRILYGIRSNHRNSRLFRALLMNGKFARQFVITMMDLYNVNFHPDFSVTKLGRLTDIYRPLMERHFERWGGSIGTFNNDINVVSTFLHNVRTRMTTTYLPTYFANLGITASNLFDVTLLSNVPGDAPITINTVTPSLASGSWTGRYYSPLGVTVRANVPSGHVFTGWTVEGGTAQSPSEITTFVEFDGNVQITANFARN